MRRSSVFTSFAVVDHTRRRRAAGDAGRSQNPTNLRAMHLAQRVLFDIRVNRPLIVFGAHVRARLRAAFQIVREARSRASKRGVSHTRRGRSHAVSAAAEVIKEVTPDSAESTSYLRTAVRGALCLKKQGSHGAENESPTYAAPPSPVPHAPLMRHSYVECGGQSTSEGADGTPSAQDLSATTAVSDDMLSSFLAKTYGGMSDGATCLGSQRRGWAFTSGQDRADGDDGENLETGRSSGDPPSGQRSAPGVAPHQVTSAAVHRR
ncbi:hypothetical protein HYPSUDRAFT_207925 [Hypholoma sublateritium FD-334 SS-4]|uniref:Uncharacterized protein n=1 Tax=Hypholoma sublateritium (strain FD-334 SS-4) TaxID=945553 RepID=A0A0D2P4G4_HYPSF|nr:hypothetical protein HYPSUDRAFT_207925 [Hypholoma sublateritium FD-334 SS-4]